MTSTMYPLVQIDFDCSLNKHPFFTGPTFLIRSLSLYCFTFSEYSRNESFDFFQQLTNERDMPETKTTALLSNEEGCYI